MKKAIIPIILALCLIPLSYGASEPQLISVVSPNWETEEPLVLGGYAPTLNDDEMHFPVWNDYIAIPWADANSGGSNVASGGFDIYNYRTGTLVYRQKDLQACARSFYTGIGSYDAVYYNGYLIFSTAGVPNTQCGGVPGDTSSTRIYDVSNLAFVTLQDYIGNNYLSLRDTYNPAVFQDGTNFYLYDDLQNDGIYYNQTGLSLVENQGFNGVVSFSGSNPGGNEQPIIDLTNYVYSINGCLYGLWEREEFSPANVTLGCIEAGFGTDFNDWNRNPLDPEYITNLGSLVFVGGSEYNDIRTSTVAGVSYTPLFYFQRDNILGYRGNLDDYNATWSWTDWTNLTAPVTTNSNIIIPGEIVQRADDRSNKIVVVDRSDPFDPDFYIYETEEIDISFTEDLINTPPTQFLEFLGVDINDNFIFKNTLYDKEGGRIYQAQQLNPSFQDINDLWIEYVIGFEQETDEDYVTSSKFDEGLLNFVDVMDGTPGFIVSGSFNDYLQYDHSYTGTMEITLPISPTASDTNIVGMGVTYVYHDFFTPISNIITHTISFVDQSDRYLLRLHVIRDEDLENITIWTIDENDNFDELILENFNLSGDGDYYNLLPNFNFATGNATINLVTNETIAIADYQVPFTDPTAFGVDKILFGELATDSPYESFYIDRIAISYLRNSIPYPEYEQIDLFEAGETQVFATSHEENTGFGQYVLYSWATDNTLGIDNYDYLTTLSFTYDNDTEVLDQNTINQIIQEGQKQAGVTEGFSPVSFIEGDLITDTFFGVLDEWNIKSTASKFFVGLILILLLIGIGAYIPEAIGVKSSAMLHTIGAVFGGIGGLFLVTYWGLFPLWVTFTVTLVVILAVASAVRNGLLGRGGG